MVGLEGLLGSGFLLALPAEDWWVGWVWVWVCSFIEEMAAAHTNHHAAFENLTRKHEIVCSPPEGIAVESVVLCIGNLIWMENVRAASQMSKRVIVFVANVNLVARVVEQGLVLDQTP